jgi:hypothetical protein
MKIRPVGAELFHAGKTTERWTDGQMTKLVVAFRSLANGPKNEAITLRSSSNVLKHSEVNVRTLKLVQVLGGLQILSVRKHLKISYELGAKDRQMA